MSDQSNDELIERAREVSEQYVGTYLPQSIERMIANNELEQLEFVVKLGEEQIELDEREATDVE